MKKIKLLSNICAYLMVFALVVVSVHAAQSTVNLGLAESFAIFDEATITDASPITSVIVGDVGVHPAAGTLIVDVSCTNVDGTIYDNNAGYTGGHNSNITCLVTDLAPFAILGTVRGDMDIARGDVQARLGDDVTHDTLNAGPITPGTLTGLTFYPGVHIFDTSTAVDITGDIYLDCEGNSSGVFIFQLGSTLTLESGKKIILQGNCQAPNIFWAVSGATVLKTTAVFEGTILSEVNIATQADSVVHGRLLGQTGVTLDGTTNTVTIPVLASPVLTTITLLPVSANITVGSTQQLTATGLDQYGAPIAATINYASNDTVVATVNATSGLVNAVASGSAAITASSGAVSGSSTITVVAASPVLTTITLLPVSANITVGSTQQLTATGLDQYGAPIAATINYASNDTVVATVNATSGLVNAVASGSAAITASSGAVSGTSVITVEAASPILNHIGSRIVTQGNWLNFTITATSPGGFNLTFAIAGPSTASFTDNHNGTAVFSWMPNSSEVGVTNVNFTVTDSIKSASEAVTITVNAFQAPTTISTNPDANLQAVDLGTSGNFIILAKSGISNTGTTSIVGDIGVSPVAATYITGFGLIMDSLNEFSTSSMVTGKVYAADYAVPTPTVMTAAVSDMETAYTDAAGRTLPDYTELGAGNIGGMTLTPGLYKWSTGVTIPADVILSGSSSDVWIFQIAQTLDISNGRKVILSGGAQAKNIFWQVAGQVTLGTTSVFNGNILGQTAIVLNTGATFNGRALAQTAVTLDADSVSLPAEAALVWKKADYNVTLNATGFNNTPIAYINYSLNNVPGQISGGFGTVLINTSGNNTVLFYAVDTSGNVETQNTIYALLDKTAPNITSFTLSSTSVNTGITITGTCTVTDSLDTNIVGVVTGIDTATAGSKTATCTATDLAGNIAQAFVTYTVNTVSSVGDDTVSSGGSSGGGGGSGVSWNCTEWSACNSEGIRTKTCTKPNSLDKSTQKQSCTPTTTQITTTNTSRQNTAASPPQGTGQSQENNGITTPTGGNPITGMVTLETQPSKFPAVWVIGGLLMALLIAALIYALAIMKPTRPNPFGDVHPVMDIEGIGPEYNKELHAMGIKNTGQLWDADAVKVARETGAPLGSVKSWQSMAELASVHDIGPQYGELLERSGIHSIDQLKNSDPNKLLKLVRKKQDALKLNIQGNFPGYASVKHWIDEARNHEFGA